MGVSQDHLWEQPDVHRTMLYYTSSPELDKALLEGSFVTAAPKRTVVGFGPQNALRLNSTINCTSIDPSLFEASCKGDFPWRVSHNGNETRYGNTKSRLESFSACVPGDVRPYPWKLSGDMDVLEEHLYISTRTNLSSIYASKREKTQSEPDLAYHCIGRTTKGFFELPSLSNDRTIGPIQLKAPPEVLRWYKTQEEYARPRLLVPRGSVPPPPFPIDTSNEDTWKQYEDWKDIYHATYAAPLLSSAIVLFSDYSEFLDGRGVPKFFFRLPLTAAALLEDLQEGTFKEYLLKYSFNVPFLQRSLQTMMFLGNRQAVLNAGESWNIEDVYETKKMFASLGAIIGLSALLFIQLGGLMSIALWMFITTRPGR